MRATAKVSGVYGSIFIGTRSKKRAKTPNQKHGKVKTFSRDEITNYLKNKEN